MHIKAKKSLGQNFLIDREVLEKIVSTVEIANKEILEIGPGSGNLTSYILKNNPKKVFVVEKDDELSLVFVLKYMLLNFHYLALFPKLLCWLYQ